MHPHETSRTTSTTKHRRSQTQTSRRLKIIQAQVGHECDSSTAVYTHVSDDFMNAALRRALAPALDTDHGIGAGQKEGR
jgi:integrase